MSFKRIACYMSEKKYQKFSWYEFERICVENNYVAFKLDLEQDLYSQGPFDVLIHKLTDVIIRANLGDKKCISAIHNLELYLSKHPNIIVVDPLNNVRQLLDRGVYYNIIHMISKNNIEVFTPNFCEITSSDPVAIKKSLKAANVHYPFICKPIVGHGSKAHQMSIIFNDKCLKDCVPPCVAQSFINHNAVLYKIYVVGDKMHVCERPSLKNFHAGSQETIFFDSTNISKVGSQNELITLAPDEIQGEVIKPDVNVLEKISRSLRQAFGLDLFGIDVIIESITGKYAVVDVNSCPGYDGFPDFFPSLMELIKNKLLSHMQCNELGLSTK